MGLTLFFFPNKNSVFQAQAGVFFRFFCRFEDEIFLWLFLDYMPYFITKTDFISILQAPVVQRVDSAVGG